MKMKSLVLLAVALGFGFVAMLGVRQAMSNKTAAVKTQRILVAREDIRPFTKIEPFQVTFEEWAVDKLPQGAITEISEYDGRATRGVVAARQAITKSMLTEKGNYGVANLIPEGMRVSTVKVNTTQAHSGLVKMGDKIDILVTYKVPGDSRPRTKTVLEMIEVFSVDQQVAEQQKDEAAEKGKIKIENLSVLVTPDQAARLSQAQAKGTLEMTLRNPHDKTLSNTNMLTDEDFETLEASMGKERETPKFPEVSEAPAPVAVPAVELQPAPMAEPVVELVDAAPQPAPWVITIYEHETVRNEEIVPSGGVALTPEPVDLKSSTQPKAPAPEKAGEPVQSPNGPSANEPAEKSPKSARTGSARGKTTASLGN